MQALLFAVLAQLATVPEGATAHDAVFAEKAVACRAKSDKGWVVVTHMGTYGPFEWVDVPVLGRGVAFAAKQDGRMAMVVDGKSGERFDAADAPAFSSDGKLAYRVRVGERHAVVADGKRGRFFEYVQAPVWSPDGKTVAYAAEAPENKALVVVNGEERGFGEYYDASHASFSSDGTFAYRARSLAGWREAIIVAGKRGPDFDTVGGPVWSADGKSLAYRARRGRVREEGSWHVVVDGKEGPAHEAVGEPVFASDGVVYAVRKEGKWRVGDGEAFDEIRELNGARSYIGRVGKEEFVVVDGKRAGPYDAAWGLTGRMYAARRGERRFVVVDGREGAAADYVGPPTASGYGVRVGRELWWKALP